MKAWKEDLKVNNEVLLLSDGNGIITASPNPLGASLIRETSLLDQSQIRCYALLIWMGLLSSSIWRKGLSLLSIELPISCSIGQYLLYNDPDNDYDLAYVISRWLDMQKSYQYQYPLKIRNQTMSLLVPYQSILTMYNPQIPILHKVEYCIFVLDFQNVSLSLTQPQKLVLGGEGCPSLIYYNLALSLADVGLGFFPIHPFTPSTSWA